MLCFILFVLQHGKDAKHAYLFGETRQGRGAHVVVAGHETLKNSIHINYATGLFVYFVSKPVFTYEIHARA